MSYNKQNILRFLPKATALFHKNFTHHTFGSVDNFGFLIGVPNGSSVNF
jgi:hypothetical protein